MVRPRTSLALVTLLIFASVGRAADSSAADEELLKKGGVATDAAGLTAFIRKLSATDADRKEIANLIRQLGDNKFAAREAASKQLLAWGMVALEPLRIAMKDMDAEIAHRATQCVQEIENGPAPHLPAAAVRLMAVRRPPTATADLLAYLGHTNDAEVHEAVLDTLAQLSAKAEQPDASLTTALKDTVVMRRAAAGYVLGRSKDARVRASVQPLLTDRVAAVRWRAVQGFVAAHDRAAIPILIDLTLEADSTISWQVEDLLGRLAGEEVPDLPTADDAAGRQKRRDGWAQWWKDKGAKVDLAKLETAAPFLNRTLVPEMHVGKVWEFDHAGKVLWELKGDLKSPIDAQVLPNGRILIAELSGRRVAERDRTGKILWQKEVDTPIACQRFGANLTFIGTNHRLLVVDAAGKETWSYKPPAGFFIHSVQRMRNGHYAMVSMSGTLKEIDAAGKEIRSFNLPAQGSWNGIEAVAGDHYVVCGGGLVAEVDATGKVVWQYKVESANYAQRLPNGNTFIVSGSRGLLEVDKAGKTISERKMTSSVWRAHRR